MLEGEAEALDKMVAQGKLAFSERRDAEVASENTGVVEAVVGEHSSLIGRSARELTFFDMTGLNLLAVSRRDKRFTERLAEIKFQNGDVVVLQGDLQELPYLLRQWDCLPLVERNLKLGSVRNGLVPVLILALAMGSTALGLVPVPIAFFAAAVTMVVTRTVPLREVYSHLGAPILLMLAALLTISDALRTTGATDLIANWLSATASVLPPYGALALIMAVAMAVIPCLNNAATVLVMAPIAATFATDLGYQPEAFLMAVAIGAGSDFLTPIGHQCNTLVMGPGGYRFGDHWRLGPPLSVLVLLVSVPMLMLVWSI
ncbi:MAG: family permease [Devosia sp.]|nr:family permease [Devosia sp.]